MRLEKGIIMDTCAQHNAMTRRVIGKKLIRPSVGSRNGVRYVGACGETFRSVGEVRFPI